MSIFGKKKPNPVFQYLGAPAFIDSHSAILAVTTQIADAAAIQTATGQNNLGNAWHQASQQGQLNLAGRRLISVDSSDSQNAASSAAGLALSGLRTIHFNGQGQSAIALQEALHSAVGKRLPYVFHLPCQAVTKATRSNACSHDDYHNLQNTGCIQLFAHDAQTLIDFCVISHKIAELTLNPVVLAYDAGITDGQFTGLRMPESELLTVYLGQANDSIESPTAAQQLIFGNTRRRIPETWNIDQPLRIGAKQSSDSYMQTVAGQRPYYFEPISASIDACFDEWYQLTGRRYERLHCVACDSADYLILAQGSVVALAEHSTQILKKRGLNIGVIDIALLRPFPGDLLSQQLQGKKGVLVLERSDQPLSPELPILADVRSMIGKALENGRQKQTVHEGYARYNKTEDIPPLYSACYGLGGQALTPGDLIAAVDNMLPEGQQQPFVYLGIDFVFSGSITPQQEIEQQNLLEKFPNIANQSLKPAPVQKQSSSMLGLIGSSAATIEVGVQLADTLYQNLNLPVSAYPLAYEGQTLLIIAPGQTSARTDLGVDYLIVMDSERFFNDSKALERLNPNSIVLLNSTITDSGLLWQQISSDVQIRLQQQHIQIFALDAVAIVKELTADTSKHSVLQHDLLIQSLWQIAGLNETFNLSAETLIFNTEYQTGLMERSLADTVRLDIDQQLIDNAIDTDVIPSLLQNQPTSTLPLANIHRFWNQTGQPYRFNQALTSDPFMASGVLPAATGVFGASTQRRTQHPVWIAENCTACAQCYIACPDTAISGLVHSVSEVFATNIQRIEKSGRLTRHLRRAVRTVEKKYHALTADKSTGTTLEPLMAKAIGDTIKEYAEPEREEVAEEFEWFKQAAGDFRFALTEPYHDEMNNRMPRNGGLFSVTINPESCKGCMECVSVCETEALQTVPQTTESLQKLQNHWNYWLDLPSTHKKYLSLDHLEQKNALLGSLLLDKQNFLSTYHNDNTVPGCSEKTAVHLFSSTVSALMQPRVQQHVKRIEQSIRDMEQHIRLQLASTMDISDLDALENAIDHNLNADLTLSRLSGALDEGRTTQPIDRDWLRHCLQILSRLKALHACYTVNPTRAHLGVSEGSGDNVWQADFPYNPYPFPWAAYLADQAPALALGLFEGQMAKMADGFKTLRQAELEIKGRFDPSDDSLASFNWRDFSDTEYQLCPPLVIVEADGKGFNAGLQSLSDSLTANCPVKILLLDNRNRTDVTQWPKEAALITMAHRSAFFQQSSLASAAHLLEGFIDGLNYRGPAVWSIYCGTQSERGLAAGSLMRHSRLALESRAYPLIRFDPRHGSHWEDHLCLAGNPDLDQDWIFYTLPYHDEYGNQFSMDLPLTYADWAYTVPEYADHFKAVEGDENTRDHRIPISDYLILSASEREDHEAFVWTTDPHSHRLQRQVVSKALIQATEERRDFWQLLKALNGSLRVEVDTQAIADQAKAEMAQMITEGLMNMIAGDSGALQRILTDIPTVAPVQPKPVIKPPSKPAEPPPAPEAKKPVAPSKPEKTEKPLAKPKSEGFDPVWIDTPDCTTCDECVEIAPAIFQYNSEKKAIVIDPMAGTYEDIVRAAEKCTAVIIHPGTPWNPDEPNLEKLIKRAEKFQ